MLLVPVPLVPLKAAADDHGKLVASIYALDDVLGDGDADLEVSLTNAATKAAVFVLKFGQKFFRHPFVTILSINFYFA